jgi:hypothetical protein
MGFRPVVIERQLIHEEGNTVRAAYTRIRLKDLSLRATYGSVI